MNNKGFTLTELIVTMAIAGILLALTTLDFNSWSRKAQMERQTRELFAELNQARIDSLHQKRRHAIVMQPNSYVFRRYSTENESRFSGTTLRSVNFTYQVTKESGSSAADDIIEFNIRGFTNDFDTYRINPVGTGAQVDCIVIATGRTNLGKMESGACVVK